METSILIALITSFASIIVAVISLISNKINSKSLIETNKALEELKFGFERKKSRFQLVDKALENQYSQLAAQISHIQSFKDHLLFIESSVKDSLDTETALTGIKEKMEAMFECYEKASGDLDKVGLQTAHSAKNQTLGIETKLKAFFKGKEYVQLNAEEKEYISASRNKLSEYQNILRDLRMNILVDISKD